MSAEDPRLGKIQALAAPILEDKRMELVELTCRAQGGQLAVRLLVDCVGGVTLQQCAWANQQIRTALELSGLIPEGFSIEVSSPGLDRPLVTKRDFERALGEDLKLDVRVDGGRFKELQGMLLAVWPEALVVRTPQGNVTVAMANVRAAKKTARW